MNFYNENNISWKNSVNDQNEFMKDYEINDLSNDNI